MERKDHDPRYLGYFDCFNQQRFFEAHEVLEGLWLPQRQGANGCFYKGLIQIAGAFVHWQKKRPGPARALFALARINLQPYAASHEGLNVAGVLALIGTWESQVKAASPGDRPPVPTGAQQPRLELLSGR